jgi:hypothetical protein
MERMQSDLKLVTFKSDYPGEEIIRIHSLKNDNTAVTW